ncbi:MAG: hypothetical protein QXN36_01285 [Candidatus Bathyarchaeia archaeon]
MAEDVNKTLTVDDLIQVLGSTVKHDDENKAITFLAMLLTYTEEDQINIGYLAESSTGKSYIPLELSWYFPDEDVIKLGYASPTAFFHGYGKLMLKEGIPVNWEAKPTKAKIKENLEFDMDKPSREHVENVYRKKMREWNQLLKGSYYLIDLQKKIIIFLDQPHDQLLQRLRALLSHDEKEVVAWITDKKEKAGLRTKNIVIKGFATVVFCTAKFTMAEQEKTRLLLLSPEINQEKLRETIALKIEKEADREAFNKRMMEDPARRLLKERVANVKAAQIKYVRIPEEKRSQIYQQFLEDHKFLIPRHQRDITRLLAIIKAHALLNFMHRERVGDTIIVNDEDVEAGFRLYYGVAEANELGLPPEIFRIFQHLKPYLEDKENGINRKEFQQWYYNTYHKVIGRDRASDILKILDGSGLIVEQPDPLDKRYMRYVLPDMGVKNSAGVENSTPNFSHTYLNQKLN